MLEYIVALMIYCSNTSQQTQTDKLIETTYPQIPALVQNYNQLNKAEKEIDYAEKLKWLGYFKEEKDDEELNLRNAIIRFQSEHNLVADGIWGPKSMAALRVRLERVFLEYSDEVDEPPTKEKWITINKTNRVLTLYEGKKALNKYPVAVGNPPSLTPSGKFEIVVKVVDPMWGGGGYADPIEGGVPENPLGYRWLGLSLGEGNVYGVHGNNSPYSIGTYASRGCIRMINSDVESLFEIIPNHSPVWIGDDEELKEFEVIQEVYGY